MASTGGSSTAISTIGPPTNIQWQIDIPSLADMIRKIGAEGLKKIQMSGVDIHTIGCLLALGEITPASDTFRRKLVGYRREQRSRQWFFNAVIEYGSGTNAVVDQLLNTRAGENILSLITTVCSVLDNGTVEVLNTIFELLRVPFDSTPGISQLQNVRSVCLPLARMTDFKDRVARTHEMILREAFPQKRVFHYQDALPDSKTMANLVITLKDFCIERTSGHKLVYYGITGASWLIEYSKDVLDLDVCLIYEDGTIRPVKGTYDTSSVVVLPANAGATEVLRPLAQPTDVILLAERKQRSNAISWLMSCGEGGVDFFQLSCGWDLKHRQEVGDLAYSIAKEYVEHRVYLGDMAHAKRGTPYFASYLGKTLENLRGILNLLGLPQRLTFKEDWRHAHFKKRVESGRELWALKLQLFSRMTERQGPGSCHTCPPETPMLQPEELANFPIFCVRCQLQTVVLSVAYRASCLAFTDWVDESRQMAFGAANFGRKYFQHIYSKTPGEMISNDSTTQQQSPEILTLNAEILGEELLTLIAGARMALDRLEIPKQKYIGVDLDGILLISYRAIEPSLRPGPIFIIREGQFSLGGEHRPVLREVPFYTNMQRNFRENEPFDEDVDEDSETTLKPANDYPRMKASLSVEASVTKDAIHLNYIVTLDPGTNLQRVVQVGAILNNLQLLKVTTPCCHSFDRPLRACIKTLNSVKGEKLRWFRDDSGSLWTVPCIPEALSPDKEPLEAELTLVYYYPVIDNPLAQWLSIANARGITNKPKDHIYILQRECCLTCTIEQAKLWASVSPFCQKWRFSIISSRASNDGRLVGDLDSDESYFSPSPIPPSTV